MSGAALPASSGLFVVLLLAAVVFLPMLAVGALPLLAVVPFGVVTGIRQRRQRG